MTAELHADAMKRKRLTEDLISEAYNKIARISMINPNDYPVYMEFHYAALLRHIQREAGELLAKHEKDEGELWSQTAKPAICATPYLKSAHGGAGSAPGTRARRGTSR